jgi:hypothetical protein
VVVTLAAEVAVTLEVMQEVTLEVMQEGTLDQDTQKVPLPYRDIQALLRPHRDIQDQLLLREVTEVPPRVDTELLLMASLRWTPMWHPGSGLWIRTSLARSRSPS